MQRITETTEGKAYDSARKDWSDCDNRAGLLGHPLFGATYSDEDLDKLASEWQCEYNIKSLVW